MLLLAGLEGGREGEGRQTVVRNNVNAAELSS